MTTAQETNVSKGKAPTPPKGEELKQAQAEKNNDPVNQPHDVEAMKASDPMKKWPNDKGRDPDNSPHAMLQSADQLNNSGKDISKVNAPVVSLNPSSGKTLDSEKALDNIKFIDNPNRYQGSQMNFKYPFDELEMDQGFFVPLEAGQNTDNLIADIQKQIYMFQQQTGECEKDQNGDDVWESVVIQTKKRIDGVIQLEPNGKPVVGANQTNRPKLIHSANFIVRPVVAGDEITYTDDDSEGEKAETDGALVIRAL